MFHHSSDAHKNLIAHLFSCLRMTTVRKTFEISWLKKNLLSSLMNVTTTALQFTLLIFFPFLSDKSLISQQSTEQFTTFFTRLCLDDRLTREFTYLQMCSWDSIFIKIVQFIGGIFSRLNLKSFQAFSVIKVKAKFFFVRSSLKTRILLSLLSWNLNKKRAKNVFCSVVFFFGSFERLKNTHERTIFQWKPHQMENVLCYWYCYVALLTFSWDLKFLQQNNSSWLC